MLILVPCINACIPFMPPDISAIVAEGIDNEDAKYECSDSGDSSSRETSWSSSFWKSSSL